MSDCINSKDLFDLLINKSQLKNKVFQNVKESFQMMRSAAQEFVNGYTAYHAAVSSSEFIVVEYKDRGEFEFELTFAGDVLVFMLHTNIFEFSRMHEVMKSGYIREDNERSYCGVIHIYNFLADSFRYQRENDLGYLIGRIFVNKENHYFVEGKREIGLLYNNFHSAIMTAETACEILKSSIQYCIHFDLLTPPYDEVKQITLADIQVNLDRMRFSVGKRLGFRFQADEDIL